MIMLETGLEKRCPRCGRVGKVYKHPTEPDEYRVLWTGRPRNPFGVPVDGDDIGLRELLDPEMGCGYDGTYKGPPVRFAGQ